MVTAGGMTADEITGVLHKEAWDVAEALERIQRFLIGDKRVTLMHLRLRKVVGERMGAQRGSYEQRLCAGARASISAGTTTPLPTSCSTIPSIFRPKSSSARCTSSYLTRGSAARRSTSPATLAPHKELSKGMV